MECERTFDVQGAEIGMTKELEKSFFDRLDKNTVCFTYLYLSCVIGFMDDDRDVA